MRNTYIDTKSTATGVRGVRRPRFDREWLTLIGLLPSERQDIVATAIREYQLSGVMPSGLDGAEMMAFMLIKKIVDRRARRREARRLSACRRTEAEVIANRRLAEKARFIRDIMERRRNTAAKHRHGTSAGKICSVYDSEIEAMERAGTLSEFLDRYLGPDST